MDRQSGSLKLGLIAGLTLLVAASCAAAPALSDVVHACVLVEEGKAAFAQQQPYRAIKCLEEAARLRPGWLPPPQWLALAYQVSGNKDMALESYRAVQRESLATAQFRRRNPPDQLEAVVECEALAAWLINQTRYESGLKCLLPEPKLAQMARQHSLEMRDLGYFSHQSPVPGRTTSMERFAALFGFRPQWIAENVARRWGTAYLLTPEKIAETHRNFLKKPHHRANLLLDKVERMGVGLAVNENGDYWLTQVLAKYQGE